MKRPEIRLEDLICEYIKVYDKEDLKNAQPPLDAALRDPSEISEAQPGARVTLLGRDGDASISADDWATWARTINYEIVARLPREVPRVYVDSTRPRSAQRATVGVP